MEVAYEELKKNVLASVQSREVTNHLKDTIKSAVKESTDEFSKVSFIERQKTVRTEMFQNTERLLYGFNTLSAHLEHEEEYIEMVFKNTSGSIVKFQKNKVERPSDDQLLEDRMQSYLRSKNDYERVKQALEKISDRKGYAIIEMRYLSQTEITPTWEGIANALRGTNGFSENLSEKTVRRYKNKLINELSILLFGTDAI